MNFKAVLALPKMARSAQTHKSISFIWIVWSTLYVYLWVYPQLLLNHSHLVPISCIKYFVLIEPLPTFLAIQFPRYTFIHMCAHLNLGWLQFATNQSVVLIATLRYWYYKSERIKQMEQVLNFQVPPEGLELVILLRTQY